MDTKLVDEARKLARVASVIADCLSILPDCEMQERERWAVLKFLHMCLRNVQDSADKPFRAAYYDDVLVDVRKCRRWLYRHVATQELPKAVLVLSFNGHNDDTEKEEAAWPTK